MLYRRAAAAYQKVHMETSPARMLDGLLGRLLRDMDDARAAIERRDIKAKSQHVDHALRIISELVNALDFRQAPELCQQLSNLYGFVEECLLEASLKLEPRRLAEARKVVEMIHESNRQAAGLAV
jgi:flagellar biosynthetic protein FliS